MKYQYNILTKFLFGANQLEELHNEKLPGKKALVVISNGKSTKVNGYLDRLCKQLELAGVQYIVFDKVQPNPELANIDEGAKIVREEKCDFLIGLGGGSCIDAAKAIAFVSPNEGSYWDYVPTGTGGRKTIKNLPLPIVAITTTAGTGSEANNAWVVSKEDTNEKIGMGTPYTFPVLSVVDPTLMVSIPRNYTIYQGFDAFFPCCRVISDYET